MNQIIYFYLINNKKYVDFRILLFIYSRPEDFYYERSNLWRYLKSSKIRTKFIGNKKVFLLDDIFSDIVLVNNMQNIAVMAEVLGGE